MFLLLEAEDRRDNFFNLGWAFEKNVAFTKKHVFFLINKGVSITHYIICVFAIDSQRSLLLPGYFIL